MPNTFGDFLRSQRKSLKLRLQDVQDSLEVSKQVISNWETNKSMPPQSRLVAIGGAYQLDHTDLLEHYSGTKENSRAVEAGQGFRYICEMIDSVADKARTDDQHRWIFHSLSTGHYLTSSEPQIGESVFNCAAAGVDIAYIHLPVSELESDSNAVLARSLKQKIGQKKPGAKQQEEASRHLWVVCPKKMPRGTDMAAFSGRILGIFTRVIALIKAAPLDDKDAGDWQKRLFPTYEEVERFWLDIAIPDPKSGVVGPHWVPIEAKGTKLGFKYMVELSERLKQLKAANFLINSRPSD